MPVYEYECNECGGIEEAILPISSDPKKLLSCSKCKSDSKRIISNIGYSKLKGTPPMGWNSRVLPRKKSYVPDPMSAQIARRKGN